MLIVLLTLLTGQHGQMINLLDVRNMEISQGYAKFVLSDLIKTSRPGPHVQQFEFKANAPDRKLCVHTALLAYLQHILAKLWQTYTATFC